MGGAAERVLSRAGNEGRPSRMAAGLPGCARRTAALPIPIESRPCKQLQQHTRGQTLGVSTAQGWKTRSRGGVRGEDYTLPPAGAWPATTAGSSTLHLQSLIFFLPLLAAPINPKS